MQFHTSCKSCAKKMNYFTTYLFMVFTLKHHFYLYLCIHWEAGSSQILIPSQISSITKTGQGLKQGAGDSVQISPMGDRSLSKEPSPRPPYQQKQESGARAAKAIQVLQGRTCTSAWSLRKNQGLILKQTVPNLFSCFQASPFPTSWRRQPPPIPKSLRILMHNSGFLRRLASLGSCPSVSPSRNFSQISHVGAGAQAPGPCSTAFTGALAESWSRHGCDRHTYGRQHVTEGNSTTLTPTKFFTLKAKFCPRCF